MEVVWVLSPLKSFFFFELTSTCEMERTMTRSRGSDADEGLFSARLVVTV